MENNKKVGRSRIDGTGCNPVNSKDRMNLSKRAIVGDLIVEKGQTCPKCGHHKRFVGNLGKAPNYNGQNIIKCSRCRHYYK
jgi:hypothetical protein